MIRTGIQPATKNPAGCLERREFFRLTSCGDQNIPCLRVVGVSMRECARMARSK
jgi:hypothetical protein